MNLRDLKIADFHYSLPEEKIALYPLAERDSSKLLVYGGKGTDIRTSTFRNIGDFLPENSFLVFNNTKVVRARLVFLKNPADPDSARIEIFCLEPVEPADISLAFAASRRCRFKCLIGNNKRWKEGPLSMDFEGGCLKARRVEALDEAFVVEFSWEPAEKSFAEVLEAAGRVPLPPYIHREAEESDTLRYQTVFAKYDGSVAAPTAGLHFTDSVMQNLQERGIRKNFVTLHVGAGTFKPVKSEEIGKHLMHREHITATRALVEDLLEALREGRTIIPVGTTSMRTLESLYWSGVRCITDGSARHTPEVGQWDPYEDYAGAQDRISPEQALRAVLDYMDERHANQMDACTALMIAPGYKFALCKGLVTNFHQPQSTLLLLVSALIGPVWRQIYDYALKNDFRFLSYGDSCLFLPPENANKKD